MDPSYALRLKEWRKKQQLSQRELSKVIGVSSGYIGDIEAGRTEPSRNFLNSLNEKFGVSADWVLHGTGSQIVGQIDESSAPASSARPVIDETLLLICGAQVASVYASLGKRLSREDHFREAVWLANQLLSNMTNPEDGDELEALLPGLKAVLAERLENAPPKRATSLT